MGVGKQTGNVLVRENTKEYAILKELLEGNEKASVEVVERRLGGAKLFGVAHAYATNGRIIIVRRYIFGLRRSLKIINFSDITEVNIDRGILFCKVHFALVGEYPKNESERKWLLGLKYGEALEIVKFVNRMGAKATIRP
jgi:hypothetical protein